MSGTNKLVIVIAVILILIFGKIAINNKKSEDNNTTTDTTKITQTTNQVATKKSNGIFEIYNTDIKTNTGSTKLTATISNISGNKTEKQRLEIILIDANGNEIGTMLTTIPSLEANTSTEISAEDLKVYTNIYDFKIKQ